MSDGRLNAVFGIPALALFSGGAGAAFATGRWPLGIALTVFAVGFAYHVWAGLKD